MKILFLQDDAVVLGGTKTLIARLAGKFLDRGDTVDVLFKTNRSSAAVMRAFPEGVQFFFFDSSCRAKLTFPYRLRRNLPDFSERYDAIFTLSLDAYYFSMILKAYCGLKGPSYFYVVNPNAIQNDLGRQLKLPTVKESPVESFIFMNDECRSRFEEYIPLKGRSAAIIPLPVKPRESLLDQPVLNRIVSIGRIDPDMKTYNWNFIEDVVKLRQKYPNLVWDIYGTGDVASITMLKAKIEEYECASFIRFKGGVEHSEMESVLSGAVAFVGMGTAAVEAAFTGTPAIVAIAFSETPAAYGMLHELPFGNVGEQNESLVEKPLGSILDDILSMNTEQYIKLREASRAFAFRYDVDAIFQRLSEYIQMNPRLVDYVPARSLWNVFNYLLFRVRVKLKQICSAWNLA
jgi:glycosyltransferase involved in cell wall biosynthesis